MLFPAAFLQGIYYNGERPQYLNFGGIGAMIGHEMTHGFDALGRVFDENGRLAENVKIIFTSKNFNEKDSMEKIEEIHELNDRKCERLVDR